MKTAVLRGPEHTRIGDVATIAEGQVAVALSRGGAAKTYSHKDPNEDAAGFAEAEGGVLLSLADGHGGSEASEKAIDHLLAEHAARWTALDAGDLRERWSEIAPAVLFETSCAIVGHTTRSGATSSRTALVLAVVRRHEGWMAWASMGDCHLFHVGESGEVVDLVDRDGGQTFFLGHPAETEQTLREKCVVGVEELSGTRALVLVSDGISEQGIGVDVPETTVAECADHALRAPGAPDLRPLGTARGVVEASLEAHRRHRSGDNVACAVVWLEERA